MMSETAAFADHPYRLESQTRNAALEIEGHVLKRALLVRHVWANEESIEVHTQHTTAWAIVSPINS